MIKITHSTGSKSDIKGNANRNKNNKREKIERERRER